MSYPKVQTGLLTLPSGTFTMKFLNTKSQQQIPNYNVAGAGEGTQDTHPVYVQGLKVEEYIGTGVVKKYGADVYGLSQNSTMTMPSNMDVKAMSWRLRRWWPLVDVSGSGDAAKEYCYGLPNTSMSLGGVAKTGYIADHGSESLTMTTLIAQVGTLAGTLKLAQKATESKHFAGGVSMVQMAGQFSGVPTFTPVTGPGTNDDFEWLLGTSVVDPIEATMTLDIGDSTDLTPNVMVHDVSVEAVPRDGGAVRLSCRLRTTL